MKDKIQNGDNTPTEITPITSVNDNLPITPHTETEVLAAVEMVEVDKQQLNALILQNQALKQEVGVLVGVFSQFQGFFNGKSNAIQMMATVTKLLSNKELSASLEHVFPILDKYNGQNQ